MLYIYSRPKWMKQEVAAIEKTIKKFCLSGIQICVCFLLSLVSVVPMEYVPDVNK